MTATRSSAVLTAVVAALLAPACSTTASAPAAGVRASAEPDWELDGWRIIVCCCPSPCPCRLNKKPSFCHGCDHTDVVHVERGHLGAVAMDGVTWTTVGRGFGADVAKNWVYVYVDDDATDEQVAALQGMLNGNVAALGPKAPYLAGKFVGLREVPMTATRSKDQREYGVSIPGILEFQTRAIVNPGHTEPVVSTGIMDGFGDRFVHSDTLAHRYEDASIGYAWDLTGRQSNQAEFTIDQARVARGGIGWGCWTAHADFGDAEPYGEEFGKHGDGE